MSTIRFFSPASGPVFPVWVFGGNSNGGIGDLLLLSNGMIVLRGSDTTSRARPTIYAAYGPNGRVRATSDVTIMPASGPQPASGSFTLSYGANSTGAIAVPASAATVAAALNLLASITAAGGVTVTGPSGGPFDVIFSVNGVRTAITGVASFGTGLNIAAVGVLNLLTVNGGSAGAPAEFTFAPAVAAPGALGLLLGSSGTPNNALLGTTVGSDSQSATMNQITTVGGIPQYAMLATGMAAVEIAGHPYLLCAGRFQNYYRAAGSTSANGLVLIDLATGANETAFVSAGFSLNAAITSGALIAPLVFEDGLGGFGLYGIGGTVSAVTTDNFPTYVTSFGGDFPTGLGALQSILWPNGGSSVTLTAAPGSYGATGIIAPLRLNTDGSAGTAYASGLQSLGRPSGGWQDCFFKRPSLDGTHTGAALGNGCTTSFSVASGVVTVAISFSTNIPNPLPSGWRVIFGGGSTGGTYDLTMPSALTVANAVSALFPECAMSYVDGSTTSRFLVTVTLTLPSGARYAPYISGNYNVYPTGQTVKANGPLNFMGLVSADGSQSDYYPFPEKIVGGAASRVSLKASAVAVNAGQVCHVYCVADVNGNLSWTVTLPGKGRANIALNFPSGGTNNGRNSVNNGWPEAPVSVAPLGTGFALALPYAPVYTSVDGSPLKYAYNLAAVGASTILLASPIIVIDQSGNPDTSFDAVCFANFWSQSFSTGVRFGPRSLLVKGSRLYFGSLYIPQYIDNSHFTPIVNSQGDLDPAPTWNPFFAPGDQCEVFCACDASGSRILPPDHP